jgi:hypothetical protein
MFQCEKCWESICECGYQYNHYSIQRLIIFRNSIDELIRQKEKEKEIT